MTMLRFTDGMQFDTSGKLRTEERSDGWYVVGEGMLCAVDSKEDGDRFIQARRERSEKKEEAKYDGEVVAAEDKAYSRSR